MKISSFDVVDKKAYDDNQVPYWLTFKLSDERGWRGSCGSEHEP